MRLLLPFRSPITDSANRALHKDWERALRTLEATYGVYRPVVYDATMYSASGAMTWTVDLVDQVTLMSCLMGSRLEVAFVIRGAVVGGTPGPTLQIEIPGTDDRGNALIAAHDVTQPVFIDDNGTLAIGVARVVAGGGVIEIEKVDGSNWAAGANGVEGQIAFEVR